MCTVTIDQSSVTAIQHGSATQVSVSGTASNCASGEIEVSLSCAGQAGSGSSVSIVNGTWTASFQSKCSCGSAVTITAACAGATSCSDTFQTTLDCGCCPTIQTAPPQQGLYDSAGNCLVTFVTTVTFPAGCTATVQRDFGDGTFGLARTFTTSPQTFSETHPYAPGAGYSSVMNVTSNGPCLPASPDLTGVVQAAPICATNPYAAVACDIFRLIFVVSLTIVGVLMIVSPAPTCNASSYLPLVTGLLIVAAVALIVIVALCRRCICSGIPLLFGQIVTAVGLVLILFWTVPNCAVPAYFPLPAIVLLVAFAVFFIGAYGILYSTWYKPFRNTCPLKICDYWTAFQGAVLAALYAGLVVAFVPSLAILPVALVPFLALVLFLLAASVQISSWSQSAGMC